MKKATRLVIEYNGNIIFIKRTKKQINKKDVYFVLPGGCLDESEDFETAGIREAKEELSVNIEIQELLTEIYNEELDKLERFYFAKIVSGRPKPGKGEEFQNQSVDSKYGLYEVVQISKKEMGAYNILPIEIKDILLAKFV